MIRRNGNWASVEISSTGCFASLHVSRLQHGQRNFGTFMCHAVLSTISGIFRFQRRFSFPGVRMGRLTVSRLHQKLKNPKTQSWGNWGNRRNITTTGQLGCGGSRSSSMRVSPPHTSVPFSLEYFSASPSSSSRDVWLTAKSSEIQQMPCFGQVPRCLRRWPPTGNRLRFTRSQTIRGSTYLAVSRRCPPEVRGRREYAESKGHEHRPAIVKKYGLRTRRPKPVGAAEAHILHDPSHPPIQQNVLHILICDEKRKPVRAGDNDTAFRTKYET